MLFTEKFYIDLGTSNTVIFSTKHGFLMREASVIAQKAFMGKRKVSLCSGNSAKLMLGKNPENIFVERPLKQGVIADFEKTAEMLHYFLKNIKKNIFWFKPKILISLPNEVSRYEKTAVKELGLSLGAGKVTLIDEPLAAALGEGLSVSEADGKMIIDIGGGITEVAVISLGGIVASGSIRYASIDIDEDIVNHLRSKFNFLIGEQTAEKLKIQIGNAIRNNNLFCLTGGINLNNLIPQKINISSDDIFIPINNFVRKIQNLISEVLEKCPPEIAADISQNGVVLTGGGALLRNLDQRLSKEFGLKFRIAKNPLSSVAMGGVKTLKNSF